MTRCDYRCLKPDGAQCELAANHHGPHRNGLLIWHDPPVLYVDGKPYEPTEQIAICTSDPSCQAAVDEHNPDCPVERSLQDEFGGF